jgi:hypothetical protein
MKTLALTALMALGAMSLQQERVVLRQAGSIPLAGIDGRIDNLDIDVAAKRLYVAALGNNSIEVVDLAAQKTIKSVPGFSAPQSVRILTGHDHLVAANGTSGRVAFLDSNTFAPTTSVQPGDDPHVAYDASAGRVYISGGNTLTVLDTEGHALGTVKLAGRASSVVLESGGQRAFVNVSSERQIDVVDREKRTFLAKWPVNLALQCASMALDEVRHRLFVACAKPARLLVFDMAAGRFIAGMQVAEDPGSVSYDATRKRVYVSGDAEVTVLEQTDADHYRIIQRLKTAPDARTSLFVPELNQLLVAVPHHGGDRAEIRIYAPVD